MKKSIAIIAIILSFILILAIALPVSAFKTIAVKGIKLNKTKITLNIGQTFKLKVTLTPANTTQKSYKFVTGNTNIATVDAKGTIKSIGKGTTKITVYSYNKKISSQCNVTVTQPAPVKLTMFMGHDPTMDPLDNGDPGNRPIYKEIMRRTNVEIKFILGAVADKQQKFRLMLATNDAPDICPNIEEIDYPGGKAKAEKDGIIAKLNPYLDTLLPNYKSVLMSNPDWKKEVTTDDGDMLVFYLFHKSKASVVFYGPMIREDILNKAKVPLPETIGEWHAALKALKEVGNISTPFTCQADKLYYCDAFVGAYNVGSFIYMDTDGKLRFGCTEDGFKQWLQVFNQWYKEGLLDPEFLTNKDQNVVDTKMASGKAGAAVNWMSRVKKSNGDGQKINPEFKLTAVKYPVLKKGDTPFRHAEDPACRAQYSVGACHGVTKVKAAMKFIDYFYSPEGQRLANFGLEDVSYSLKNGVPTYTDEFIKNPKGWTLSQCTNMYIMANWPTIEDPDSYTQLKLTNPAQLNASEKWSLGKYPAAIPTYSFSEDETKLISKYPSIDSYTKEMITKFIVGTEPFSKWDEYKKRIKELDIDEVLAAYNKANDRYNKR